MAGIATVIGDWGFGPAARINLVAAALILAGLTFCRAWDRGVLGQGADEFNRVLRGTAIAAVVLALAGMALKIEQVRPWIFGVIPATGAGLLLGRYAVRRVLHRARRDARCMSSVLVVGSEAAVADLVARTRRVPHHGWTVTAACTSTGAGEIAGVPVVGDLDDVARHVHELGIEVVAVAPTPGWTPKRLHSLAWDLEGAGVELVVDPGLMEITGPRLHVAPVDGLPLLRLTEPRWGGPARMAKNLFDRAAAAALVLILAPVFLTLAVLIRRDGGPVFYRQERVGRAGQTVPDDQVPLDGRERRPAGRAARRRQRGRRPAVQDEARPAHHPHRRGAAPPLARRAPPAVQRHRRLDVAGRPPPRPAARGRHLHRGRAAQAPASARASPASGRSAAAPTSPGRSRSAWTCATSRTGPPLSTSRSSGRRSARCSAAAAPTERPFSTLRTSFP